MNVNLAANRGKTHAQITDELLTAGGVDKRKFTPEDVARADRYFEYFVAVSKIVNDNIAA